MRLIDSDTAIEYIKKVDEMTGKILLADAEGIIEFLKRQKTVETQKHGKWIDGEVRGAMAQFCSVCGCDSGVLYLYSYCPHCGAKMDLSP